MTGPLLACPVCAGPQMPGHPAGRLAIDHRDPCALRNAEDATQAADVDRAATVGWMWPRRFVRPVTPAEATLLAALGIKHTGVTRVSIWNPAVRNRTWQTPSTSTPGGIAA